MSRFKNITFLLAIACVISMSSFAIAQKEAKSDAAETTSVLSSDLAELSFMLGEWSGTIESRRSPFAEFDSGKAEMSIRSILDGSAIEAVYSGVVAKRLRRGSGRLSYNPHNKTFQRGWTDSLTSVMLLSEGTYADSQLTMSGSGSLFGLSYLYREVTTNLSDTSMSWQGEISLNDGESWFVMLRGWFLRVE